jgi:hypothetical protein
MATGISAYLANKWLEAACKATSYSAANVYVQLHIGSPGSAGTSNLATETSRKLTTFATASAGIITSNADASWTNIAGSQTATFFTAWDAATSGNFLFSGSITASAYTAGDTFIISSGQLSASLTVAS